MSSSSEGSGDSCLSKSGKLAHRMRRTRGRKLIHKTKGCQPLDLGSMGSLWYLRRSRPPMGVQKRQHCLLQLSMAKSFSSWLSQRTAKILTSLTFCATLLPLDGRTEFAESCVLPPTQYHMRSYELNGSVQRHRSWSCAGQIVKAAF